MTDEFDDDLIDDDLLDDRDRDTDVEMTGGSPTTDGGAAASATWPADDPADDPPDADVVELEPPRIRNARWGILQALWWMYRHRKKRAKLTSQGYVQWYLVDDAFPNPKFVKPEYSGKGTRDFKHDGARYIFPRDAMLSTQEQGMWTVIHRKGEADPINLRDSSKSSIPADALQDYLDMQATAEPPSFWDKFDMDAADAMKWLIVGFVGIVVLQQLM